MRKVFALLIVVVIGGQGMASSSALTTVNASSRVVSVDGKKVCRYVTKTVHGKKKRVKVCKTVKPKPTPSPTPIPSIGAMGTIHGVAVDAQGNVYVAAEEAGYLLKLSPSGHIVAAWAIPPDPKTGTPPYVNGVALDAQGSIYLSDAHNSQILKLSPQGTVVAHWETLHKEHGVDIYNTAGPAVDGQGNIYITNWDYGDVEKYSPSGRLILSFGKLCPMLSNTAKPTCADATYIGGPGCETTFLPMCVDPTDLPPGELNHPYGLALDTQGNIYVSDHYNRRIVKFSPSGAQLAVFGSQLPPPYGPLSVSEGVAVDAHGNLYDICAGLKPRVVKFSPSGQPVAQWTPPDPYNPAGDAGVDANGNLYVTLISETAPSEVVKLSPELQLLQEWK